MFIFVIKQIIVHKGTIIKSTGKWYTVQTNEGNTYECTIKGKFRLKGIRTTNPVAVGDHVEFELDEKTSTGIVTNIKERTNYIIRKSVNLSHQSHILAANIDQAVLMVTIAYPETYLEFIDRYLLSAEAYRIPTVIVFNKTDLYNNDQKQRLQQTLEIYQNIGYECTPVSVVKNDNIEQVKRILKNKVSVLSGISGVGKSTLINNIDPALNLKTQEISEHHKTGKHVTTFPEMHKLSIGGFVIDTPGIRAFGLAGVQKDEIFHFFPEIFEASHNCKFHNCLHVHEPGCAVINAVENGAISESRYKSYINILEEEEGKYR
jgi:ribosome biogenesis GTPase